MFQSGRAINILDKIPEPNIAWSSDAPDPSSSIAPYQIYNIGNTEPTTIKELAAKIVRIGKLPINIQTQFFYNVETPDTGADWSARFQVQFLFPK